MGLSDVGGVAESGWDHEFHGLPLREELNELTKPFKTQKVQK